jgi:hypothetical protein
MGWLRTRFASCRTVARLADPSGVPSQEQGAPIRVCTGPTVPIAAIWARAGWVG